MSIFDSMNPAKLALMAGIGLIGIGNRFFNAFAKGFEETKDLDW